VDAVVVAVPGTLCSPVIFEWLGCGLVDRLGRGVRLEPVSWLTEPGPWHLAAVAERLRRRVAELRAAYPGPVVLAGHSTGGAIVLRALADDPDVADGLVLFDTGAHMRGHGDVDRIIAGIEAAGLEPVLEPLLARSFAAPPAPGLAERLAGYARTVPVAAVLEVLRSQRDTDLTGVLPTVAVPALVVHGRKDAARPVRDAEELAAGLPDARLLLTDTGHSPMWEAPDEVAEAVATLIRRAAAGHRRGGAPAVG
jgi:pimeloyl-ACP methyl ester carboxylesterase